MVHNGSNRQDCSQMFQYGPKWSIIIHNGPNLSTMVQNSQNDLTLLDIVQNGLKLSKWFKVVKSGTI